MIKGGHPNKLEKASTWFYIYSEPHPPACLVNILKNIILQTSTKVQGKAKKSGQNAEKEFCLPFDDSGFFSKLEKETHNSDL